MKTPLKKAQDRLWELCKKITRARFGNTCYTCGARGLAGSNFHTSHFIPKSICSTELKYSLDNLRPACYRCNIHLSGNWVAYEKHLIADNGEDFVKNLKKRNEETKGGMYRLDFYQNKIAEYEEKLYEEKLKSLV